MCLQDADLLLLALLLHEPHVRVLREGTPDAAAGAMAAARKQRDKLRGPPAVGGSGGAAASAVPGGGAQEPPAEELCFEEVGAGGLQQRHSGLSGASELLNHRP